MVVSHERAWEIKIQVCAIERANFLLAIEIFIFVLWAMPVDEVWIRAISDGDLGVQYYTFQIGHHDRLRRLKR